MIAQIQQPEKLCGYAVQAWLRPGRTALCSGPSAKNLVLKALPAECLRGERLHPLVKDRLARIQQLPQMQLASLLGAERDGSRVWLVWAYVEGQTLEQFLADVSYSPQQALMLLRELLYAVEAIHSLGIVHGALYARNVIVTPRGELRLTHVSPLLYQDPLADRQALAEILRRAVDVRGLRHTPAGEAVLRALDNDAPLTAMAATLGQLVNTPTASAARPRDDDGAQLRKRSRRLAATAALATLAAAALAWWALAQGPARPPVPPQAPPELLRARE
jgi:hypothetical protein